LEQLSLYGRLPTSSSQSRERPRTGERVRRIPSLYSPILSRMTLRYSPTCARSVIRFKDRMWQDVRNAGQTILTEHGYSATPRLVKIQMNIAALLKNSMA